MVLHPRTAPLQLTAGLALLSLSTSIFAQPAPAAPGQPVEAAPTPAAPPTPPTITVDDPLLTPIPAAPKVLSTWEEAIHLVDTRSTDMRIAEEDVARAEAQSRQALGRILPTLNASASAARQSSTIDQPANSTLFGRTIPDPFTQTNSSTTTSLGATLSIPVLQPRGWYAYGTAKQSVEMVKLSTSDRRRLLITNVAAAIVTTFTTERVAEINRVGLKTALERLELTRRRARLGTATRLDVVRGVVRPTSRPSPSTSATAATTRTCSRCPSAPASTW